MFRFGNYANGRRYGLVFTRWKSRDVLWQDHSKVLTKGNVDEMACN